ncbi:hypothetical protein HMPREF1121_01481 [Porphyromonas sp. KLE 1280]|nr:hypothetical protein HMPREF1121_01481 [Porphyromonas sp. KLE 1280]
MPLVLGDTTGASRSIQVFDLAEREVLSFYLYSIRSRDPHTTEGLGSALS